jgi:ribosomal protein S27AE
MQVVEGSRYWVIYHVFGVKFGGTARYPQRCYEQGFKNGEFEIHELVSEGCGVKFVSDQEQFWNKLYKYKGQQLPYEASIKGNKISVASPNHSSKTGKGGFQNMTYREHVAAGRKAASSLNHISKNRQNAFYTGKAARASILSPNSVNKMKTTCPRCGESGNLAPMKRWHFERCVRNDNSMDS